MYTENLLCIYVSQSWEVLKICKFEITFANNNLPAAGILVVYLGNAYIIYANEI